MGDVGPDNNDAEHDRGEHHRDLDKVIDEEVHGRGKEGSLPSPKNRVRQSVGKYLKIILHLFTLRLFSHQ